MKRNLFLLLLVALTVFLMIGCEDLLGPGGNLQNPGEDGSGGSGNSEPVQWGKIISPAKATLKSASDPVIVYGQVSDSSSLIAIKLIYGQDIDQITSWGGISATENSAYTGEGVEYQAVLGSSIYNSLPLGTYYYTFAITANGTDWFYLTLEGGTPTQNITIAKMGKLTIANEFDYTETWATLSSAATASSTFSSTDLPGIMWSYTARTINTQENNMAFERGILLDNNAGRYLASPLMIGEISWADKPES